MIWVYRYCLLLILIIGFGMITNAINGRHNMEKQIEMSQARMATLFDEWLRRYIADPEAYSDFTASHVGSYGKTSTEYFILLDAEVPK